MATTLDNPVWSSLLGLHADFAHGGDGLKMYPAAMAPFAAVPCSGPLSAALLDATLGEREFVYFVGTLPQIDGGGFGVEPHADILQMICEQVQPAPRSVDVPIQPLKQSHVPAMMDLMARLYPAYFRERTIEMGPYVGIFDAGELIAMAGVRMAPAGYREISGVCTDPHYAGRGYAGALVRRLVEEIIAGGKVPMLHQDLDNARARQLYESLGFTARAQLPMCALRRATPRPR